MKLDECFKKGLLKRINPDLENASKSIDIAKSNIEDASKNLGIGCYRVVLVASYTAMFHASRSILFKDGIKERSHICIPIYLREKYKELERYADTLDSFRIFRHRAIYGLGSLIEKKEAVEALTSAKEFLGIVQKIISRKI